MSKVTIQMEKNGNHAFLSLSGIIDEDMDFSQVNLEGITSLEIDLGSVKSINSCGIREWIKWISGLQSMQIFLKNCPKVIVDQINMVHGFLPSNAKVMSFYVPFFNDDVGSEKDVLFEYGKDFTEEVVRIPDNITDDDGNPMELDVVESKYFKFLKR